MSPLRWGLYGSEPALLVGLAVFAEISPLCEFPSAIYFRLQEEGKPS